MRFGTQIALILASLSLSQMPAMAVQQRAEAPAKPSAAAPLPRVGHFYVVPAAGSSAGPAWVVFAQREDELLAEWHSADRTLYGRGKYLWDSATASFNGRTVLRSSCLDRDDGFAVRDVLVVVREQISIASASELRIRWTKPTSVNCATGEVEYFQWSEAQWMQSKVPPMLTTPAEQAQLFVEGTK